MRRPGYAFILSMKIYENQRLTYEMPWLSTRDAVKIKKAPHRGASCIRRSISY